MRPSITGSWFIPIVCLMITGYFAFHSIQGAHGFRRMHQLKEEIKIAKQIAAETRAEKELYTRKKKALMPESLDMDQLEESALRVLNMGNPNDKIIFID